MSGDNRVAFGDVMVVLWGVGMLILGVVFFSLALPEAGHDGPVDCGGEVMGPGDTCILTGGGTQSGKTYEQLHAAQLAGHGWEPVALTASLFFFVCGVVTVGLIARRILRTR